MHFGCMWLCVVVMFFPILSMVLGISALYIVSLPVTFVCSLLGLSGLSNNQIFVVTALISAIPAFLAWKKGKDFIKWYALSLCFSIPVWLYIIIFMPKTDRASSADIIAASQHVQNIQNGQMEDFRDFKEK